MGIADELERLRQLHAAGSLTDEEYRLAKERVLSADPDQLEAPDEAIDDLRGSLFGRRWKRTSLGEAANRYVSFQIVMAIVGGIVFLILFLGVWLPNWNDAQQRFPGP